MEMSRAARNSEFHYCLVYQFLYVTHQDDSKYVIFFEIEDPYFPPFFTIFTFLTFFTIVFSPRIYERGKDFALPLSG